MAAAPEVPTKRFRLSRWVSLLVVSTLLAGVSLASLPDSTAYAKSKHKTHHASKPKSKKKSTTTSTSATTAASATFSVTGTGTATITYGNGSTIESIVGETLPWSKRITKPNIYVNLQATSASTTASTSITCEISVAGKSPVKNTATGAHAHCKATATA